MYIGIDCSQSMSDKSLSPSRIAFIVGVRRFLIFVLWALLQFIRQLSKKRFRLKLFFWTVSSTVKVALFLGDWSFLGEVLWTESDISDWNHHLSRETSRKIDTIDRYSKKEKWSLSTIVEGNFRRLKESLQTLNELSCQGEFSLQNTLQLGMSSIQWVFRNNLRFYLVQRLSRSCQPGIVDHHVQSVNLWSIEYIHHLWGKFIRIDV